MEVVVAADGGRGRTRERGERTCTCSLVWSGGMQVHGWLTPHTVQYRLGGLYLRRGEEEGDCICFHHPSLGRRWDGMDLQCPGALQPNWLTACRVSGGLAATPSLL